MTWQTNVPRGDLLPRNERPRFVANWNYIQTEMRDNHYWNEDANKDGRHKRCDMPNLETTGDITVDANGDPDVIPTSTDGIYYVREKTATESPDAQNSEPFYAMNDGASMQFLQMGCRAMLTFRVSGGVIQQNGGNDWDYQHNIATVVRNSAGSFTITFTTALPTTRYIILGTCLQGTIDIDSRAMSIIPRNKLTTGFTFSTSSRGGSEDPDSVDLVVMGG